ncbi:MAG: hypothetical protein NT007_03070 [Candidatus Kapabacteria bacterium]|nr:hypothetical protein [Candidatus Kapabacteria bacterium]
MADSSDISVYDKMPPAMFGGSGNNYFSNSRKKSDLKNRFRNGEIVLGKIVGIASSREVYIELPIGTLLAELTGKLKIDDSLYFKIIETEPSLILKIYSVPVRNSGIEINSVDIQRMLDLPNIMFYSDYINFFRTQRSQIVRDDAMLLFKTYSNLNDQDTKNKRPEDIIRILYYMQENSIGTDSVVFHKLLPLFFGSKYLLGILKQLEAKVDLLSDSLGSDLKYCFNILKSSKSTASDLIIFFSLREEFSTDHPSFTKILRDIADKLNNENLPDMYHFRTLAIRILNTIEAQKLWNAYASKNNGLIQLFIPVPVEQDYIITKVNLFKPAKSGINEKNIKFSFSSDINNLGEILAQGILKDKNLNLNLSNENAKIKNRILAFLGELKFELEAKGYIVESVTASNSFRQELETAYEHLHTQPNKLSVVV